MRNRWLKPYLLLVGFGEFCTGISLLFFPATWFGLIGLVNQVQALWFMRWIGIWVAAVGLLYLLALRREDDQPGLWLATTVLRLAVAFFLLGAVILQGFPVHFLGIAGYDLALGLFQWMRRKDLFG